MREFLERLARPEDRSLWALIAIIAGYGIWGLWSGFRRKRAAEPALVPVDEPAADADRDEPDPSR